MNRSLRQDATKFSLKEGAREPVQTLHARRLRGRDEDPDVCAKEQIERGRRRSGPEIEDHVVDVEEPHAAHPSRLSPGHRQRRPGSVPLREQPEPGDGRRNELQILFRVVTLPVSGIEGDPEHRVELSADGIGVHEHDPPAQLGQVNRKVHGRNADPDAAAPAGDGDDVTCSAGGKGPRRSPAGSRNSASGMALGDLP